MHVVDLSHGSLEVAALRDVPALELRAGDVEPDELATALAVLRDVRGSRRCACARACADCRRR
ncbi:hypothetical protein [Nannocystis pusilla]|uniref:hypothetical protein n=1 Tax=Nannocystis pusilla TaxID=889268 RepID=UPI003B7F94FC